MVSRSPASSALFWSEEYPPITRGSNQTKGIPARGSQVCGVRRGWEARGRPGAGGRATGLPPCAVGAMGSVREAANPDGGRGGLTSKPGRLPAFAKNQACLFRTPSDTFQVHPWQKLSVSPSPCFGGIVAWVGLLCNFWVWSKDRAGWNASWAGRVPRALGTSTPPAPPRRLPALLPSCPPDTPLWPQLGASAPLKHRC